MAAKGFVCRSVPFLVVLIFLSQHDAPRRSEASEGRRIWATEHFGMLHPDERWKLDTRAHRLSGTMMFLKQGKGGQGSADRPFLNFAVDSAALDLTTPQALADFIEARLRRFNVSGSKTEIESVEVKADSSRLFRVSQRMFFKGATSQAYTSWVLGEAFAPGTPGAYADSLESRLLRGLGSHLDSVQVTCDTSVVGISAQFAMRARLSDSRSGKPKSKFVMHGYSDRHATSGRHVAFKELYWYVDPGEEPQPPSAKDLETLREGISHH